MITGGGEYGKIEAAIRARLAAFETAPVKYANVLQRGETPPFVYCDIRFTGSQQIGTGQGEINRLYRHEGFIMLGIYTKAGEGPGQSLAIADELAGLFRGATFGGVVCLSPVPDGGRPADEKGDFWLKTLTCDFYSDSIS